MKCFLEKRKNDIQKMNLQRTESTISPECEIS